MSMLVLSLTWALTALSVALVLGRVIRGSEDGAADGAWESFCAAHDLDDRAWEGDHVGA
jgi:hypothetical protein